MSLSAGDRLGPYEILALIGKGGMGEVYRARDTRLGRDVAIKVSQDQFSERFAREARAVAALNHPNICTLYDVGPNYLVMEYIEGESPQGPLPLELALNYARQIGAALEEAHGKGVVHRDLKPANIKIKPDGAVKVLDFGLAKIAQVEASATPEDSPTLSMAATQAGVILGTASYMSPEQARGKPVDKRADIWAFGVVLHELLTGRRLFKGEDAGDILASVIKLEPAWDAVPAQVQRLLKACLEKDPKKRLRDIGDAWRLMEEPGSGNAAPSPSRWAGWAVAAVVVLAAGIFGSRVLRPAVEQPVLQLEITAPEGASLGHWAYGLLAISPDGRRLVFFATGKDGKRMLWMRSLDTNSATPLAGSENAAGQPFWSPDSRWVAFAADGKLQKVNVARGPPQVICEALGPVGNSLGTWSSQGVIVFMQIGKPLQRVPESGGTPAVIFPFDSSRDEWGERDPYFLPDGNHFLYHSSGKETGIVLASLDDQSRRFLFASPDSPASYVRNPAGGGWILHSLQGQLLARPFDPEKGQFTGEAAPVADHLNSGPSWSASATGLLAFPLARSLQTQLTWFSRDGKPLGVLGGTGELSGPRISPDQKTVAFSRAENQNVDIWFFDIARSMPTRFTFEPGLDMLPVWSPDGSSILYSSHRLNDILVVERPVNGIGAEKVLYKQTAVAAQAFPTSLSRDNSWVVLTEGVGNQRIALLSRSDGKFVPFLQSQGESEGLISPDGRWMLYTATPAGRSEVFVQPVPKEAGGPAGATGKWQISTGGGSQAVWRADGKEIFYLGPDAKMMAAPVESSEDFFRPGTPKPLFQTRLVNLDDSRNYDVSRDGQRFLVNEPVGSVPEAPISVIANWPLLLRK